MIPMRRGTREDATMTDKAFKFAISDSVQFKSGTTMRSGTVVGMAQNIDDAFPVYDVGPYYCVKTYALGSDLCVWLPEDAVELTKGTNE